MLMAHGNAPSWCLESLVTSTRVLWSNSVDVRRMALKLGILASTITGARSDVAHTGADPFKRFIIFSNAIIYKHSTGRSMSEPTREEREENQMQAGQLVECRREGVQCRKDLHTAVQHHKAMKRSFNGILFYTYLHCLFYFIYFCFADLHQCF